MQGQCLSREVIFHNSSQFANDTARGKELGERQVSSDLFNRSTLMWLDKNNAVFFALLQAGLWGNDAQLLPYGEVDYEEIMRLAEEQSVVGLITAGLEHVTDVTVPKVELLQFIGQTLQIEERNKELNSFIPKLTRKLKTEGVYSILVKGQGVAQCYERPLLRASGDVDLLLNRKDYENAKKLLFPIAYDIANENRQTMHQAMEIMGVDVELHGKMPFLLSERVERVIDKVTEDALKRGGASVWNVEGTDVYVPNVDNHIFLVFTHFLHHFFIEGVGLRQICDWCRLLWTYRDKLDQELLESRIRRAGLMTEWRVFAALAVDKLGMPKDAMPFYDARYKSKCVRVLERILKSGNMGHNNDLSYREKYSGLTYKLVALWRRMKDFAGFTRIFPIDAPKFFVHYVFRKI